MCRGFISKQLHALYEKNTVQYTRTNRVVLLVD